MKLLKKRVHNKVSCFTDIEFEFIRKSIDNQYKNVLKELLPKEIKKTHFENSFNVNKYHEISK